MTLMLKTWRSILNILVVILKEAAQLNSFGRYHTMKFLNFLFLCWKLIYLEFLFILSILWCDMLWWFCVYFYDWEMQWWLMNTFFYVQIIEHITLEELYMPNMIAILFTLYCFPDLVLSGQNIYWEELTLCE